jgi:hypothetical protein
VASAPTARLPVASAPARTPAPGSVGTLISRTPLAPHRARPTLPTLLSVWQVVAGARATAEALGSWWRYPAKGWLCQQSGSGNNWAQGFHGYGPHVRDAALELVRREVCT